MKWQPLLKKPEPFVKTIYPETIATDAFKVYDR